MKINMKIFFLLSLLINLFCIQASHAQESLRIGVISSFYSVLEAAKPRIVQQIKTPVDIIPITNSQLYEHLNKNKLPYDVVIFGENDKLGSTITNQRIENNSQIITSTRVVLWCPDTALPKRISLSDSLLQANVHSIALPGIDSMISDIFIKAIPQLPPTILLTRTENSLTSWQLAHNDKVECAVTIDKWLKPDDQFNLVSLQFVNLRGLVADTTKFPVESKMVISIMSSPLIQPLMMRSTILGASLPKPNIKKKKAVT